MTAFEPLFGIFMIAIYGLIIAWFFALLVIPFTLLRIRRESIITNELLKEIIDNAINNAKPKPFTIGK